MKNQVLEKPQIKNVLVFNNVGLVELTRTILIKPIDPMLTTPGSQAELELTDEQYLGLLKMVVPHQMVANAVHTNGATKTRKIKTKTKTDKTMVKGPKALRGARNENGARILRRHGVVVVTRHGTGAFTICDSRNLDNILVQPNAFPELRNLVGEQAAIYSVEPKRTEALKMVPAGRLSTILDDTSVKAIESLQPRESAVIAVLRDGKVFSFKTFNPGLPRRGDSFRKNATQN